MDFLKVSRLTQWVRHTLMMGFYPVIHNFPEVLDFLCGLKLQKKYRREQKNLKEVMPKLTNFHHKGVFSLNFLPEMEEVPKNHQKTSFKTIGHA